MYFEIYIWKLATDKIDNRTSIFAFSGRIDNFRTSVAGTNPKTNFRKADTKFR